MEALLNFRFFRTALIGIVVFIVLDLLWIALIAKKIYVKELGFLATVKDGNIQFNLPVGLLVQAIIAFGLISLIVISLNVSNTLVNSIVTGIFAAFVMYATYDLTNFSFVKNYSLFITLFDMAWGSTQGLFAGLYVYFLYNSPGLS